MEASKKLSKEGFLLSKVPDQLWKIKNTLSDFNCINVFLT